MDIILPNNYKYNPYIILCICIYIYIYVYVYVYIYIYPPTPADSKGERVREERLWRTRRHLYSTILYI